MSELEELRKGSQYEKYINTAFKEISRPVVPTGPKLDALSTDEQRLQINLTRDNLKKIVSNSIINPIIEQLKKDNDLIEFNKYFNVFKRTIGESKITSSSIFFDDWQLFKQQDLGKKLSIIPEIDISSTTSTSDLKKLESLSNEELDAIFRNTVERVENKKIDDVESIKYYTYSNKVSKPLRLLNKDGIITFDNIPGSGDLMTRVNNIKIRYIYKAQNPDISMSYLKVKWSPTKVTTGTGFANTNKFLKKRLDRMNFR